MKNLFQRTLSGIVYLVVIIGSLFAGRYTFGTLFLVISILAMLEFYRLMGLKKHSVVTVSGLVYGALIFILAYLVSSDIVSLQFAAVAALFPLLMLITGLYTKNRDGIHEISSVFMGLLYTAVPFALMNCLVFPLSAGGQFTNRILLGVFALIWINDTGAYVTGMLIGRHKLFPRISPKKSWEGLIGGTVFTLIPALWMDRIMGILSMYDWLALAVLVCIFGIFGDLAESLMKRNANMKDSGNLIPGHGGVLDRFDSILFVVPVAAVYLIIRGI